MKPSSTILKESYSRLKEKNSRYSLRALAKKLDISHSYLFNILNGKKPFPKKRMEDFARVFSLDELRLNEFKKSLFYESDIVFSDKSFSQSSFSNFVPIYGKDNEIFKNWFYIPIMELTACVGFSSDLNWAAKKLGIEVKEVEAALEYLVKNDYLVLSHGKYQKKSPKGHIPTLKSKEEIRLFHIRMINKARAELINYHDDKSFSERMISGITFACNPQNLDRAKIRLNEAIHEVAEILMEGECTEVFQVNTQLFSLMEK